MPCSALLSANYDSANVPNREGFTLNSFHKILTNRYSQAPRLSGQRWTNMGHLRACCTEHKRMVQLTLLTQSSSTPKRTKAD
jgi:hypothetical protein